MPDNVLIDMQVLGDAPVRYIRSAACDLITNLSATNDWERSTGGNDVRSHHLAFQVSRMAAHMVLNSRELTIESANFLKAVIYGQMLSGIAMAIAGSSLPCSGSEHLIAHALDAKLLGLDILHGEKVGITSRFCLHLQGFKDSRIEDFFAAFEVSRVFPGCIGFSDQEMAEIFALARKMRPGRATILDTFTDVELAKRYATFIGSERGDDA
jgi:glycerol-1-phosphate dehydrogenase [NAD(P)+]